MVLLNTPVKDSHFRAADFSLKSTDGKIYRLEDCRGEKGLLVVFICNHCPYVKAIIDRLVADCKVLQEKGIGCVAIMPNDTVAYPEDSFENMKVFAREHGFTFPYLIDETQEISRAYDAVCTPDIFGFNADLVLQYRGRVDSAGMDTPDGETIHELRDGMSLVAETGLGPDQQIPSMGCSIKWQE